jgi:hypothetical protein
MNTDDPPKRNRGRAADQVQSDLVDAGFVPFSVTALVRTLRLYLCEPHELADQILNRDWRGLTPPATFLGAAMFVTGLYALARGDGNQDLLSTTDPLFWKLMATMAAPFLVGQHIVLRRSQASSHTGAIGSLLFAYTYWLGFLLLYCVGTLLISLTQPRADSPWSDPWYAGVFLVWTLPGTYVLFACQGRLLKALTAAGTRRIAAALMVGIAFAGAGAFISASLGLFETASITSR